MTRIVAGSAKGRQLAVPKTGTRPTSERVREAIFSSLEHRGYVRGDEVLDLYAGSGALGLEAASRGAERVLCVEAAAGAAKTISANARHTGLTVQVLHQRVESFLGTERPGADRRGSSVRRPPSYAFDLVFLDPPYDLSDEDLARVLDALPAVLKDSAVVVVERSSRSAEPVWPESFERYDERKMGDTRVWSARYRLQGNSIDL